MSMRSDLQAPPNQEPQEKKKWVEPVAAVLMVVPGTLAAGGTLVLSNFSGSVGGGILGGLAGAITWNLITWFYGLPSSSSHALIGGFAGAAVAKAGVIS